MKTVNTGKCELVFVPDNNLSDFNDLKKGDVIPTAGFEYEFIGFTDELTEEDIHTILNYGDGKTKHGLFHGFKCFEGLKYYHDTAQESFQSLLTANNITGRQIVLRKKD